MKINNKQFLQRMLDANIEFVLWGSEAGILHGYSNQSTKDIDLLIKNSDDNLKKFYSLICSFFSKITQNDIDSRDAVYIRTYDKKYFDIRKKFKYANAWVCDYDLVIGQAIVKNFLDCDLYVIGEHHYVQSLENSILGALSPLSENKLKSYQKNINDYRCKYGINVFNPETI